MKNNSQDIVLLKASGFLLEDNTLTDKAKVALENVGSVFKKTKVSTSSDVLGSDFLIYIGEYRTYFPTTKRSTPLEIKVKFTKLFTENPGLKWGLLLKATALYFSEEREEKYTFKASNFVMVQKGGVNSYPILEYMERIENGEEIQSKSNVNMYKIY